jgi:acyl-[acyl-carrier-protein]-phospholipid O-acyltransferase/long-chain-fatty-acid--[acyl-carrier-protein] ligase
MKDFQTIKGFFPYLIVVFLNAFTDLGHKIIIQNSVFKVYDGNDQIILTAIVNGLILLPFILLFSPSGFISDRFSKQTVMKVSAMAAVVITSCITVSYYLGYFWISFFLTFLLAAQSAIYSPAKFGYMKELVGPDNITAANAWVQSVTIVAILAGIFLYSIGFEYLLQTAEVYTTQLTLQDIAPLGFLLILGSLIELKLASSLPPTSNKEEMKQKEFSMDEYAKGEYLKSNMRLLSANKTIWLSIVGLSIFWSLSQVILATYPAYIKEYLDVTNAAVVQGLMAVSAIGIIIGSVMASKISRHYIEVGMVPVAALGIFVSILMIPMLDSLFLNGVNFFLFGVFGGLFIIPLNALIQFNASQKRLGLILAGNNFIQNIYMILFLVFTVIVALLDVSSVKIFFILAAVAFFATLYTVYMLPQSLIKVFISTLLSFRYKLHVQGLDNLPQNKGVLLLGNHISWLDWAFVQLATPRPIRFVMERSIYERKLLKPFLNFFHVIPISSRAGKKSLETVTQILNSGEIVCIFPEGTISRNGHMAEFKRGFEIACERATGVIVPFYIGGMWGTKFSRSNINFAEMKNTKFTKDVLVSFGTPLDISSSASQVKQKVFELATVSWNRYIQEFESIESCFIDSVKQKKTQTALIDSSGQEYSYYRTFTMVNLFAKLLKQNQEQNIGLLLPTTSIAYMMNMAVYFASKTAVNLNYTASVDNLVSAVDQSKIKTIYTSKQFLTKLSSKGIELHDIFDSSIQVLYLEDLKEDISKVDFVRHYLCAKLFPSSILKILYKTSNDLETTASILFSSGSEGKPKGVELSHKNILANVKQVTEMLNITRDEVFLGSLPVFHAFGLTVTTLLPMIEGIKVVCHPDPTDGLGIAKAVAKNNVTFMCATSTFLRLYLKNKKIDPLMFESLKMIFAGAEKLNSEVSREFKLKFSVDIYEGYGATECAPVISANVPNAIDTSYWQIQVGKKAGTIGMPLPGCAVKIIDPVTLDELQTDEDGLIIASGPNVMKGYLNNQEKTDEVLFKLDETIWYKTGDKGHLDKDGFITIVDRYSRFAKLGGEMVSLTAVENKIYECFKDIEDMKIVAVNLPDEKKGEKIILLMDKEIENMKQRMIDFPIASLWIPSEIKRVDAIPLLGSGKVDFATAKKMVND